MLFAGLCGMTTSFWLRGKSIKQRHARVAAEAQPLEELRRSVIDIEQRTKQSETWITAIETAKPDDSVLQTLASIAGATVEDAMIDVEMVDVQLAIEFPANLTEPPEWAQPRLEITARVSDREVANEWAKRIDLSDRVSSASVRTSINADDDLLQITGAPQATRVLP